MAKKAARSANFSINAVAIEDELSSVSLSIEQETPVVTALGSTGPERVVGNYDWTHEVAGAWDGAASQGDATIQAMIGLTGGTGSGGGRATTFDPTGAAAGTNDPNYDGGSAVLGSYTITAALGAAVTYSATLLGDSTMVRNTS